MKEIGGFIEFSPVRGEEYHKGAIRLNCGRCALEYILRARAPSKVYLPYYSCGSVSQPILKLGLNYEFYSVNDRFEPVFNKSLKETEVIIFINFFGITDSMIKKAYERFGNKAVIDNTQAFFSKRIEGLDTVYSARKFFGVSDGGYLFTDKRLDYPIEQDYSFNRGEFLFKRFETSAQESREDFLENSRRFLDIEIKHMSKLTRALLSSIDYNNAKLTRERNFLYIHSLLSELNELDIDIANINGPMVYPLLLSKEGLREYLIGRKVYVATYWKEVESRVPKGTFEYNMSRFMVPLPIDQRYGIEDMRQVYKTIAEYV